MELQPLWHSIYHSQALALLPKPLQLQTYPALEAIIVAEATVEATIALAQGVYNV